MSPYFLNSRYVLLLLTVMVTVFSTIFSLNQPEPSDGVLTCRKGGFLNNNTYYELFAVASDAEICSKVGCEVYLKNFSVVDAAVATAVCTAIVNVHSTSIAGGGFATIHLKNQNKTYVNDFVDFRETAPFKAKTEMFSKENDGSGLYKRFGTGSVGVPGFIMGLYEMWNKHGESEWAELIKPTILLLKKGVPINRSLRAAYESMEKLLSNKTDAKYYEKLKDHMKVSMKTGVYRNPRLVETLQKIADDPLSFYSFNDTDLGKIILNDFCEEFKNEYKDLYDVHGCLMTEEDFLNYTVNWKKPIVFSQDNYTFLLPQIPSSGILIKQMLQFKNKIMSGKQFTDIESLFHNLTHAFKLVFAHRNALGDEFKIRDEKKFQKAKSYYETTNENMRFYEHINKYNTTSAKDILTMTASNKFNDDRVTSGTSHISLIDSFGNSVSITTTTNYLFGSLITSNNTGIIFNNENDDFSLPGDLNLFHLPTSINNFIDAGRRPFSSMVPIIVLERGGGKKKEDTNQPALMAIGASGGSMIPTSVFQVMLHHLYFNITAKEAVHMPRIHHQLTPDVVFYDNIIPLDDEVVEQLRQRGHTVNMSDMYSSVQLVSRIRHSNSMVQGGADPRKAGGVYGT